MRESPQFPPRTPRCESFQRHANKHSGGTKFIVRLLGSARNGLDVPGLRNSVNQIENKGEGIHPQGNGIM